MTIKPHSFNVLLSFEEFDQLTVLARALDCSRGRAIRVAIRAAFTMKCNRIPTCADGRSCYVPQMHPIPPPVQAQAVQQTLPLSVPQSGTLGMGATLVGPPVELPDG